jgi:hypothetical protein
MKTAVERLQKELIPTPYDEEDLEHNRKCWEQAKEMEKEQHQETFKQSRSANIFKENMTPAWESWEEYYNQTFKQQEQ